ncbi:MAG: T9SS type A sorting domain-containing protein [candidate division Zixibacteria bacterium]|nr:T9SS type A sorting domain-containing protein [candidate division Zixibacteria bacterium]
MKRYLSIIIVIYSSIGAFSQIPVLDLVPVDTANFGIAEIQKVEFINYNNDEFKDYYIKREYDAFLFDGETLELIWQSPTYTDLNNQSLEYIESSDLWRNYSIEILPGSLFKIMWFDIPSSEPVDSFVFEGNLNYRTGIPSVGYINYSDNEYIYFQATIRAPFNYWVGDWDDAGYCYVFDFGNYALVDSFNCWMPFANQTFTHSNLNYLWHVGKGYLFDIIPGPDIVLNYTFACVYDDEFDLVDYYFCLDQYANKAELIYNSEDNSMIQLLSANEGFILYPDIFEGDNSFSYGTLNDDYYADFLYLNNELHVIYNVSTYFELLNLDLSFSNYIANDLPEGIIDIQTEDISADGTDEIYCIYPDQILICELQDNVGIDEHSAPLPAFFAGNHPNPFNASTTIEYTLPQSADVKITIYNLLGQAIASLIDSPQPAGPHQVIWDAGDLPSGMYFCKIKADNYYQSQTMLLLK